MHKHNILRIMHIFWMHIHGALSMNCQNYSCLISFNLARFGSLVCNQGRHPIRNTWGDSDLKLQGQDWTAKSLSLYGFSLSCLSMAGLVKAGLLGSKTIVHVRTGVEVKCSLKISPPIPIAFRSPKFRDPQKSKAPILRLDVLWVNLRSDSFRPMA